MTKKKDVRDKFGQVEDGWIELVDGTAFTFGAPTLDMINVEPIAYVLSKICRYNGHTKRHYSVAEHCILLADYVAGKAWATPRDVMTALHHDDAEYIIGDLARPVKHKVPAFKKIEHILDQAIAAKFNTIWPFPDWLPEFDARILQDERKTVMNPSSNNWGTDDLEPLNVSFLKFRGHWPFLIRRAFLKRHNYWAKRMLEEQGLDIHRSPNNS